MSTQDRKEKSKRHMMELPMEAITLARKFRAEMEVRSGKRVNLGQALYELALRGSQK